jgi:hypothetical protein
MGDGRCKDMALAPRAGNDQISNGPSRIPLLQAARSMARKAKIAKVKQDRCGSPRGLPLGARKLTGSYHNSALFKTSLHELDVQFRPEVIGRAKGCEKLIDARGIARKDL